MHFCSKNHLAILHFPQYDTCTYLARRTGGLYVLLLYEFVTQIYIGTFRFEIIGKQLSNSIKTTIVVMNRPACQKAYIMFTLTLSFFKASKINLSDSVRNSTSRASTLFQSIGVSMILFKSSPSAYSLFSNPSL